MSRQTVLIADDEEAICFALSREVRRHGLFPLVAADGRCAVALANSVGDELIAGILDVRMPRLDGVSAARAILEARPGTALALMTAFGDDLPPPSFGTAIRVLSKPFDLSTFAGWLVSILAPCVTNSSTTDLSTTGFSAPSQRVGAA